MTDPEYAGEYGGNMKKNRKYIWILALSAAIVYTGARSFPVSDHREMYSPQQEEGLRVGFSMVEGSNRWVTKTYEEISSSVAGIGGELIYHEPEENSRQWQYQDAMALLQEDIDYLVLLPREESIISDIAKAAEERGVPVILVSRVNRVNEECAATISIDYVKEGKLCAQELAQALQNRECIIVEIMGPDCSSIAEDRMIGFRREVQEHPNMTILKSIPGAFDQTIARDLMSEIIRANPRGTFNAVFASSDEDGLGALQALKLAGYQMEKDVAIVSVGGIQDAIKAVVAGEYTASIESGRGLGYTVSEIITRLEKGDDSSRFFVIPYRVFNSDIGEQALMLQMY